MRRALPIPAPLPQELDTQQALSQALARLDAPPLPSRAEISGESRRARRGTDANPTPAPPASPVTDPTEGAGRVDWAEVVIMRRRAAEHMTEAFTSRETEHRRPLSPEDRHMLGRSVIAQVVRHRAEELATAGHQLWDASDESAYRVAVDSAIFGYGRLQPLFDIEEAENIEIHGWDSVMVQYTTGERVQHAPVADNDEELVEAIRFLGETASPPRPFDDAHPMMTIALGNRFRLHAIGFGLSYRGCSRYSIN